MYNCIFFGSSLYSAPIVDQLLSSAKYNLVAIISKPSMIHYMTIAKQNNIHFEPIESFNQASIQKVQHIIHGHNVTCGIVADFGHIIPNEIIRSPKHGCINIHFSLLPELRGASPVQYAILQGFSTTGFSILEMEPQTKPEMDSGNIIYQEKHSLLGTETTQTLYTELFNKSSKVLPAILSSYILGEKTAVTQDHAQASFTTPSGNFDRSTLISKADAYIDVTKDAPYIERAIRAFTPWPLAWTTLEELEVILQRNSQMFTLKSPKNKQKTVQLLSATTNGSQLVINRLRVEGKKESSLQDVLNGYFQQL